MTLLLALLRLGPLALAAPLQFLTAVLSRGEARKTYAVPALAAAATACYAISGLCAALGIIAALCDWRSALVFGVGAGVTAMIAPLLFGAAIGRFTPTHHLVRLMVVLVVLGLFSWHVLSHR